MEDEGYELEESINIEKSKYKRKMRNSELYTIRKWAIPEYNEQKVNNFAVKYCKLFNIHAIEGREIYNMYLHMCLTIMWGFAVYFLILKPLIYS